LRFENNVFNFDQPFAKNLKNQTMKTFKTLKVSIVFIIILFIFSGSNCSKKDNAVTNPYGPGKGKLYFWTSGKNIVFPIVITVKNSAGQVIFPSDTSKFLYRHNPNNPSCLANYPDVLGYIDTVGNYTYTAHDQGSLNWSGSVSISEGVCHDEHLEGNCYVPNGIWKRLNNGTVGNSAGVTINWNGVLGVVTANPGSSCYKVNLTVWKNNVINACNIQYWQPTADCSNGVFGTGNLDFHYSDNTDKRLRVTIGGDGEYELE
jgi:hypothetical protein